jgi:hypothetical protein
MKGIGQRGDSNVHKAPFITQLAQEAIVVGHDEVKPGKMGKLSAVFRGGSNGWNKTWHGCREHIYSSSGKLSPAQQARPAYFITHTGLIDNKIEMG